MTVVLTLVGIFYAADAFSDWQAPLNERELNQAAEIVTTVEVAPSQRSNSLIPHPLGTQILLIELREQKKQTDDGERLAEVFVYDYGRQGSVLHLVDVTHNRILRSTDIQSPYLPLSEAEITYSKKLVWENSNINNLVSQEIIRLQGLQTQSISTVDTQQNVQPDTPFVVQSRVAIWVPDSPAHAGESGCDRERCALLSLFTHDEQSLTVEPVINLITGAVHTNLFP